MKKQNRLIKYLTILGVFIPSIGIANGYMETSGYQSVIQQSNSLNGRNFQTDPAFQPYCNEYASVSVRQAQQRTKHQCTHAIPLMNDSIKKRWSTNQWGHKGWCLSVSSHASRQELVNRENDLKRCMSTQAPANNNAQVRQDCISGDKIHKQAAKGNLNYVRACLSAGVSANVQEGNHWTPLHSAAKHGRLMTVKLLIQNGASVNARDINGRTPLSQAIAGNYLGVQNYLESQGGI